MSCENFNCFTTKEPRENAEDEKRPRGQVSLG